MPNQNEKCCAERKSRIKTTDRQYQVDDESPRTTGNSILLVNKQFHATSQLVAHRRKTIRYTEDKLDDTQKQIRTWLEDPFLLRNIRELTLTGHLPRDFYRHGSQPESEPFDFASMWAPLVELVTKATRLTQVNFDFSSAAFPLALLEALQTYHPQIKLYLWNYRREKELDHTDAAEQALAVSPILRGIRAIVLPAGRSGIDLRITAFQRIVANAPNLEIASITQRESTGPIYFLSPQEEARERKAAAKFFLHSRGPNTSIRKFTLDGFSLNKETLLEWGKHVSLSHLEDLKCSRGFPKSTYFEVAPALLPNLKHLSLNLSSARRYPEIPPLLEGYLAACAPLETISLWSWMGVISIDTILKHGTTLKTLELHEREALFLGTRRGLLSVEDVRRIRTECPQLETLTLDMDREHADWQMDLRHHKEMFQEFAQLGRRLQRMQIYLDLGTANRIATPPDRTTSSQSQNHQSSANRTKPGEGENIGDDTEDVCLEHTYNGPFDPVSRVEMKKHGELIWKIVFGNPMRTGSRVLGIKWGEWERKMSSGFPAEWVGWEQKNKTLVIVRPEERDDRYGEATAEVFGGTGEEKF
jgi:hypothetical protein